MLFASHPTVYSALFALGVSAQLPRAKLGPTTIIGRDVTLSKQDFFGGIPYAEPPVGELRLSPPILKTRLNSKSFNASDYGPACLQPGLELAQSSEDCLTLNIFRPSNLPANALLPVMFWVYGGGFFSGYAAQFNGSKIVAESVTRGTPIIYVNFNYRLGPLGFPQGQEAQDKGALNLALKDQLAALEWIQHNIGSFGGDKNKVTVFGESAGSIMNSIQFLSPEFGKYARAGIFESGSADTSINFPAVRRQNNWDLFVSGVPSCGPLANSSDTFDCLMKANSAEIYQGLVPSILNASEAFPFDPTIDGPNGLLPDIPSRLVQNGHFARLPFIAGTNLDEGTYFIPTDVNSEQFLRLSIIANFSPPVTGIYALESAADKLLQLYPNDPAVGSPFNTGNDTFGLNPVFKQFSALMGDILFQSTRRLWSQTTSEYGVKSYGYLFTQPQPQDPPYLGVTHSSEIPFVYGHPLANSTAARALSRVMINYWVSFATSLTPNDAKGVARLVWPTYMSTHQVLLQLNGDNTTIIPDTYREEGIGFINSIPLVFHHRRGL
ncbi:esterase 1 [Pluteus cervinus]|uniref:Esterase 1 n=1 Tax=Pluteus cervinus TaxID=181527 RepID=A0ACD3AKA6_9AGAR|nr:esterase 1 [Pluteus cervinus]